MVAIDPTRGFLKDVKRIVIKDAHIWVSNGELNARDIAAAARECSRRLQETLLIHKDLMDNGGANELLIELQTKGVSINGGPRASSMLNLPAAPSFHHEYSSLTCTIEIVDDVHAAIHHIHKHGSAHTECIVTQDRETADIFLCQVDSAAVFHNAITRFSDGFHFGLGAEVGISTSRIHARGPVGVDRLLTTFWIARGSGQVVDNDKGVVYTHQRSHSSSLNPVLEW